MWQVTPFTFQHVLNVLSVAWFLDTYSAKACLMRSWAQLNNALVNFWSNYSMQKNIYKGWPNYIDRICICTQMFIYILISSLAHLKGSLIPLGPEGSWPSLAFWIFLSIPLVIGLLFGHGPCFGIEPWNGLGSDSSEKVSQQNLLKDGKPTLRGLYVSD